MKHARLVRLLAIAIALSIVSPTASVAACTSSGEDLILPVAGKIEYRAGFGQQTLCGFAEFSGPSTPAKKFRRKEITGKMKFGVWSVPACPTPDYPNSYNKSASNIGIPANGSPFGWTYQASLSPGASNADGTITYTASLSILAGGGEYTAGAIFVEGIKVYDGSTIDLFPGVYNIFVGVPYVYWTPIPDSGALMGTMMIDQSRDEWNLQRTYVGSDGSFIDSGTGARFFKRQKDPLEAGGDQIAGTFSVDGPSYGSGVTQAVQSTQRTTNGTDQCFPSGSGSSKYSGTVTETLSEEDTEDAALSRARVLADAAKTSGGYSGAAATAFETSLSSALSVEVSHVDFRTEFSISCPGEYDLHVTYVEKPHGSSGPVRVTELVERRYFESGPQSTEGSIQVKNKDTDYSIIGIGLSAPCSARPPAGVPDFAIGSVQAKLSLGQSTAGSSAGYLVLKTESISAGTYTPSALMAAIAVDGSVLIVRDADNAVRQARSPQALADVIILDSSSYEVRFYAPNDIGAQNQLTKIYAVSGTPLVTYKFENPDKSQSLSKRLRIIETRGSIVRSSEYAFDAATNSWTLSNGNGLRRESKTVLVTGNDATKISTVRDDADALVSQTSRTYRTYPWGVELIQEILDPSGAALTTNYEYYGDAANDGGAYGHLRQQTDASGAWVIHTYDSLGRALKTIRPYLNAAPTDAEDRCRVSSNIYDTILDADGDSIAESLRTTVEFVLGQEVARSYRIDWSNSVMFASDRCTNRTDIRCASAGAAWNDGANLVTKTLTYADNVFVGRLHRIQNPDGTAILTTYSIDSSRQLTTTIKAGAVNSSLDDIVSGTRTIRFTSPTGQEVGASTSDIASGLPLNSWTATSFDALSRPTRLDYSDGTYETKDYACCGLSSARDRDGIISSYTYDDLGQQTTVTRSGIVVRTSYNADGRVKSITRIGRDNSELIQESFTYDLTGRLSERRDALNRVTSYAEAYDDATGRTTRTTTLPSGTSIEVHARDGSLLSTRGTAIAPRSYEYGIENGELVTKQIFLGENLAATEWIKTYTDFLGRAYRSAYADAAAARSYFNAIGQLVRQVDPDGVSTLFGYNTRGEQNVVAVDFDGNTAIDLGGLDRVTTTVNDVANRGTYVVQRTTTQVYETNNQATPTTLTVTEVATDGLHSWHTERGLTSFSVATLDSLGGRTIVTTAPDTTFTTQVYVANRLRSVVTSCPLLGTLASVTYRYDAHDRVLSSTDARTGATAYSYYDDDQIRTVITPDPDPSRTGPGYDPQTTTYTYNLAGRVDTVTQPDNSVVNTTYYPHGALKRVWGSRLYPTEYSYDLQGRLKTLTTWQDFTGNVGQAVTTWNYDSKRGWLANKRYADNTGPSYSYTPAGRLLNRAWARTPVVTTTYGYNNAGDLLSIDYSDSTPDVALTYDRLGRPKTMHDGAGDRAFTFDAAGKLKDENYTAGSLSGLGVHRSYDAQSRLNSLSVLSAPATISQAFYDYDAASRLKTVTVGVNTATYGYEQNSSLIQTTTFAQDGSTRLVAAKEYDNLYRLTSITNTPSSATASTVDYAYNSANQRTKATREDGSHWNYAYDGLGQVTAGTKFDALDSVFPNCDFAWTYDDIGNRKTAVINSQNSSFVANSLNAYTTRTVPGVVDVAGAASITATVTVALNGGLPQATTRKGELYFKQFVMDNEAAAQKPSIAITAVKNLVGAGGEDAVTTVNRTSFVPLSPETFVHDTDGNLTDDARWHYTWDAEHRLISIETAVGAVAPNGPISAVDSVLLEFAYDAEGRRVSKKVYKWIESAWVLSTSARFLYDGWNLIAELDALTGNTPISTHTWGLDLSGSQQGAGGVGGLLFSNTYLSLASYTPHSPSFDGNGNIINLTDLATGTTSATYDYNAFGETVQSEGETSASNRFRFSTKYTDDETGLLYYGYRFYSSSTGRWLSRDPIEENGGLNLYGFVGNHATQAIDFLGLDDGWTDVENLTENYSHANGALDTAQAISRGAYSLTNFALDAGIEAVKFELGLRAAGIVVRGALVIRTLGNGERVVYSGRAAEKILADEIAALKKGAEARKCIAVERRFMNPNDIRFSQDSIAADFKDPKYGSIDDLVSDLLNNRVNVGDIEPIRLVERNGYLISIDNRRLEAFRRAGVRVPTRMATPGEVRQAIGQGKFSAGEFGSPTIRVRSAK